MAKGSASEAQLGAIHTALTKVFSAVLDTYLIKLEQMKDALESGAATEDAAKELLDDAEESLADALSAELVTKFEPSPAMLSAIAKFLKDNEISFDREETNTLGDLNARLRQLKSSRKSASNVVDLPLTGE